MKTLATRNVKMYTPSWPDYKDDSNPRFQKVLVTVEIKKDVSSRGFTRKQIARLCQRIEKTLSSKNREVSARV